MTATKEITELERDYRSFEWPRPVFELALRWLRECDPGPPTEVTLVHGDFRHGNLIIGPDGVRAVLDWELAHSAIRWRISLDLRQFVALRRDRQASRRFSSWEELFAGYEAAARRVDPARVICSGKMMGPLRWGVMCCGMMQRFRTGPEHSIERAMIGRRSSETEIDLLRLLSPRQS